MKWILRFFFSLLFLIVFMMGAAFTVWTKPELVLTDARINQLFDRYAGAYFSKRPENLKLSLTPFTFTGKRVHVEASSFCLKEPEACFQTIQINFAFKLVTLTKVEIEEIGPIDIRNESLRYQILETKEEPKKASSSSPLSDHLAIPGNVVVKDIVIDFPKNKIENQKELITGAINLTAKALEKLVFSVQAESNDGLKASLVLHTAFALNQENPFDANLHFEDHFVADGSLKGAVDWPNLKGKIEGGIEIKKLMPWFNTLYVRNLKIERQDGKAKIDADIETKLDQRLSPENSKSVLPKVALTTLIKGKIQAVEEKGATHYQINLGPTHDKGIQFETSVSGKFPIPENEKYCYGIEKAFLAFDIPVFRDFVNSLKNTNFDVPAPFATLMGRVSLHIGNDGGDFAENTLPITFITDLSSSEQTIKTDSHAKVTFSKTSEQIKIVGESLIKDFKFTMPDLKILQPAPLVKNDPRLIKTGSPKKLIVKKVVPKPNPDSEKSRLDMEWKISTAPSGIRIFYPVLKPYAPIEVTWNIGRTKQGSIDFQPFSIEYLNHGAKITHLRFYQNANDTRFHYEGKLVVERTDYTIFVDVIQDEDAPKVVLTSDPPLDQSDIISVLLFNQTATELDSDETNSVASTQSAVTSRALGLFSILTLSSTPVEAVNFNPSTGIYSARVKLANGLTATVGTDWDHNQEVALRKRLGKNFVLSTILLNDPDTNTQTREALIEWFKRF
jgi:hypothetical protein